MIMNRCSAVPLPLGILTIPEVKDFFSKALSVRAGKDIHEKETEAEAAEMRKLIDGLGENGRKEVKKLQEEYKTKADKLGLEDLLFSIKDEA
ncbi:V-type ATP synthase subunit H domain protein [Oesophagostomum dentatum]|uniref:V-type ATP synthase subunit H domain protein n=1 Tax=Oesophagostomum dentatum TaxID=61180 RepID=A0A0B1TH19_OESDE|nr:V-type ATP synthase subunit H domain protein [Oesophagostomum dentatum]